MNRIGPFVLLLAAFGTVDANAQCSMTIQFSAQSDCGGLNWAVMSVANGTPPYDAQVYHGSLQVASLTNVPASSLNGGAAPGTYAAATPGTTITVTDALGCTAQGSAMTPAVHAVLPNFVTSVDCGTGLTILRCTGFTDWYDGAAAYTPCDWPGRTCTVNGTNMGTVAASWVNEGGGVWRFGQLLGSGGHNFTFSGTNLPCNSALECWGNTFVGTTSINPGDCGVNFRLRTALDGALPSGTLMTDGLRAANLIPTTQPYTALGYTFVGSPTDISISPAQLADVGDDAIVDWLIVELRNAAAPHTIVYSKPALLQRDGDVIDVVGAPYINCPIPAGDYRVAVRHRNHLGIMSGYSLPLTVDPYGTTALVDFRSSFMGTYGTNARVLKGGVWCLWAGDATGDGTLKYTGASNDRDPILTAIGGSAPNAVVTNVYDRRDTNLDGVIKYTGSGNDRDIILTNVGSATPNGVRVQQLP